MASDWAVLCSSEDIGRTVIWGEDELSPIGGIVTCRAEQVYVRHEQEGGIVFTIMITP